MIKFFNILEKNIGGASSGVDMSNNMGPGQSGQAIKLFQITPYVNDLQTLNNPVPDSLLIGASKN